MTELCVAEQVRQLCLSSLKKAGAERRSREAPGQLANPAPAGPGSSAAGPYQLGFTHGEERGRERFPRENT